MGVKQTYIEPASHLYNVTSVFKRAVPSVYGALELNKVYYDFVSCREAMQNAVNLAVMPEVGGIFKARIAAHLACTYVDYNFINRHGEFLDEGATLNIPGIINARLVGSILQEKKQLLTEALELKDIVFAAKEAGTSETRTTIREWLTKEVDYA